MKIIKHIPALAAGAIIGWYYDSGLVLVLIAVSILAYAAGFLTGRNPKNKITNDNT